MSATSNLSSNVVHYRPARRPAPRSASAFSRQLRLEGSLAGTTTLAPVIPMFPLLTFSLPPRELEPVGPKPKY